MPPTIEIQLTVDEFNFLRSVLGDLPTKTNAWILLNNLERQAQAQGAQAAAESAAQAQPQ